MIDKYHVEAVQGIDKYGMPESPSPFLLRSVFGSLRPPFDPPEFPPINSKIHTGAGSSFMQRAFM